VKKFVTLTRSNNVEILLIRNLIRVWYELMAVIKMTSHLDKIIALEASIRAEVKTGTAIDKSTSVYQGL